MQLAAAGRIEIAQNSRIVVLEASPTGDALADEALAALAGLKRAPWIKEWMAWQRIVLVDRYLERLAAEGTIRAKGKVLGLFGGAGRWVVVDAGRVRDAKSRLAAIASTTGSMTSQEATFAGLVHAVGLDASLFPNRKDLAVTQVADAIQVATWSAIQSSVVAAHQAVAQHHHVGHHAAHQAGLHGSHHHGGTGIGGAGGNVHHHGGHGGGHGGGHSGGHH